LEGQYVVRTYKEGDEAEFVSLFNQAYNRYAGFVPRTEDYWLWCCLDRPGVSPEGIIVVEEKHNGKIVGYAVAGKSGNIWEFCVDQNPDRKRVISMLFEGVSEYLRRVNAERIVLNIPSDDLMMQEVCAQQDFFELPPDQMFIGVTDFEALIVALTKNAKKKLTDFKQTVTFELLDARPWVNPVFSMKIGAEIQVFPEPISTDVYIKVSSDVLASILLGETYPSKAFLERKLRVIPLWKTSKALKFLGAIRMHNSWFYSLADYG
jgi:putative sterol carrier protein